MRSTAQVSYRLLAHRLIKTNNGVRLGRRWLVLDQLEVEARGFEPLPTMLLPAHDLHTDRAQRLPDDTPVDTPNGASSAQLGSRVPDIRITSHDQKGGVTAHTVNAETTPPPPPRRRWFTTAVGIFTIIGAIAAVVGTWLLLRN
jgi:hypothetical protein